MDDVSAHDSGQGRPLDHDRDPPPLTSVEMVLEHVTDKLAERFAGVFARETNDRCVHESYVALYRTATIKTHLPTFAYRFALSG